MTRIGDRRVTLIILDGARHDVFSHLVAAGDLPNISRYLLEPGGQTPATTVFPSTTGVAYLPFLTGCYPGTCDIPGIRWMDVARYRGRWWTDRAHVRSYCGYQGGMLNDDLRQGIASVFDLEPDSVALCSPFKRGLAPERDLVGFARMFWGGLAHYTAGYLPLERAVGRELARVSGRHRLTLAVFPGVDGVTHFHHPWHAHVLNVYREFDAIMGACAAAGGFDGDHLTLLVSDHGLERVEQHTDIALALEARGVATLRHPVVWRRDPLAAVMVSGNGSAQVYLRPGVLRERQHTVEEIEAGEIAGIPRDLVGYLAGLPGIAMVAGAGAGGGVDLISSSGRSRIEDRGECIGYVPGTGDVLKLGDAAVRSDRDWLTATMESAFPDSPTQLLQLFRSARTGDLVVVAEPGTDLRSDWEIPEHRSGHGSLIAEHMRCLVAVNRPRVEAVRTVDLFPAMLGHLGIAVPEGTDGVAPPWPS